RTALSNARKNQTVDRRLNRLFETAIAAGRRARSGRTASSGNLAQSAVAWLRGKTIVSGRPIVVAGAGRMGAALAHSVAGAGAEVTVASRDAGKAARPAQMYGGRGVDLPTGAQLTSAAAGLAAAPRCRWTEPGATAGRPLPPTGDLSSPPADPGPAARPRDGSLPE